MRLISSPTSPYARKVRMVALEKGLMERITLVTLNPLNDIAALAPVNPLGKVPALVLDSGEAIYDSLVICEYLDQLDGRPTLVPANGTARFQALTLHALAQGITDAALNIVMERRRQAEQQSPFWQERWQSAIRRGLENLDGQPRLRTDEWDLAKIATACALGYLEFRLPDLLWPERTGILQAWWDKAKSRQSFVETSPTP